MRQRGSGFSLSRAICFWVGGALIIGMLSGDWFPMIPILGAVAVVLMGAKVIR